MVLGNTSRTMWRTIWLPVLIPTLILKSNCDMNKTDSDVYIQYSGHAEADLPDRILETPKKTTTTTTTTTTVKTTTAANMTTVDTTTVEATTVETTQEAPKTTTLRQTTTVKISEEQTDPVLFLPERRGYRNEDYVDGVRIKDLMMMKPLPEVMNTKFHDEKQLDAQKEDVVFIAGKNGETDVDKQEKNVKKQDFNPNQVDEYEELEPKLTPKPRLNCKNLDCSNTLNSMCGAKLVNRELKYRLFLNECYFRKINCGLKYEINRYKPVELEKCKTVGTHNAERPFSFQPRNYNFEKVQTQTETPDGRRVHAKRRSLTLITDGVFCSHPCPVSCPEDYDPQCAISVTGQKRVFVNHCQLDYNSCFYGVVWHKSPLAECVGGQKAELQQSRGFIAWMQRIGILDSKGRLILE